MIRLLCIGDLHIREGEHLDDVERCLAFAVQVANERDAHGVLLAGDAFEGKSSPAERGLLADALANLATDSGSGRRPVIVIKGNHDQAGDLGVYSLHPDVTVCERPRVVRLQNPRCVTSVDVLCVPWPERAYLAAAGHAGEAGEQAGSAALAAMLRATNATRGDIDHPLVVLAHLQVLGAMTSSAQPLIGRAIEAVLGDLQDLGAAAVLLGHVHKPQQLALGVEYVGSLTCHDFGEEDEAKRLVLLTVHDDGAAEWESIPVPCRRWATVEAAVFESSEGPPYVAESLDGMKWISPPSLPNGARWMDGANIRYRYTCTEDDQHLFDHAEIERRFAVAHTLKIVPVVERAARVRAADVAAARTVEEKLAAWGVATGTPIAESMTEKLHQLEEEAANG